MELVTMKLSQIKPYPNNPRLNNDAVKAVMESIQQCTYIAPIIVDEDNVILAGHTRHKAMKKLGWKECEVIVKEGLTEEQKRKYRLLDNKTNELADWDFDMLAVELEGLDFGDLDLDWGVEEPKEETEVVEDDYDAEPPTEPKAKRGDIYRLGRHRLMCGDSTSTEDVQTLIGGVQIDLMHTDPPYGINADKMTLGTGKRDFHRGDWDSETPDIMPMMAYAKTHCIWGGNYFANVLPVTNNWLCWHKKNDGLSFSEFELAWTDYGKNTRIIQHHWGSEKKLHPTMKPVEVCAWAIKMAGDCKTVVDLFGGSGSTLIACEQLERNCYMMEYDPKYVDVIIDRWEKFTGEQAVLIHAGEN